MVSEDEERSKKGSVPGGVYVPFDPAGTDPLKGVNVMNLQDVMRRVDELSGGHGGGGGREAPGAGATSSEMMKEISEKYGDDFLRGVNADDRGDSSEERSQAGAATPAAGPTAVPHPSTTTSEETKDRSSETLRTYSCKKLEYFNELARSYAPGAVGSLGSCTPDGRFVPPPADQPPYQYYTTPLYDWNLDLDLTRPLYDWKNFERDLPKQKGSAFHAWHIALVVLALLVALVSYACRASRHRAQADKRSRLPTWAPPDVPPPRAPPPPAQERYDDALGSLVQPPPVPQHAPNAPADPELSRLHIGFVVPPSPPAAAATPPPPYPGPPVPEHAGPDWVAPPPSYRSAVAASAPTAPAAPP